MLDNKTRYLQIAFNYDASMVASLLPRIPHSSRILIEAGTPYHQARRDAGHPLYPPHVARDDCR